MGLRHAVLGLLLERERSGYELVREFDARRSLVWPAPKAEVYRELKKLKTAGFIRQSSKGARNRTSWVATDAGKAELVRWAAEDADYRLSYDPMLRAAFLDQLPKRLRREVLARDRSFFEAQLQALATPTTQPKRRAAHRMVTQFYEAMLAWADEELRTL